MTLNLVTESESDAPININYEVGREVKGADLLLWPNFIHRRWGRYFLYSELPHNSNQIQAHPFVGTLDEQFVMVKAKTGDPHFISEEGKVAEAPENAGLDVKLHVSYTQAVQDNAYKYEVFESNQPFKGFKLRSAGKGCRILYDSVRQHEGEFRTASESPVRAGGCFGAGLPRSGLRKHQYIHRILQRS